MIKALSFFIVGYVVLAGAMPAGWADSQEKEAPMPLETTHEELKMNAEYTTPTALAKIPPIDQAAPAVFETATFGLG